MPEAVREFSMRRLLFASVAGLFVEMILIRWIGTEVRIFAYVQNLALVACFLGFGVGCYRAQRSPQWRGAMFSLVALMLVAYFPSQAWNRFLLEVSDLLAMSSDGAIWGASVTIPVPLLTVGAVVLVSGLLVALVLTMIPFGQVVGAELGMAPNVVQAYSVNLIGSLIGVWLLAALSFAWVAAPAWFALTYLCIALLMGASKRSLVAASALCLLTLATPYFVEAPTIWSPYQKLTVTERDSGEKVVIVNGTGYMSLADTTPESLRANPGIASELPNSSYDSPFRFISGRERVLIIGSGGGNDVAGALRNGFAQIDAVEIDPGILSIGRRLHPAKPYQDPRVRVVVNDARNYMRTTQERYDAVVFGLLDSHTSFSGQTNMRVDNYVYTEESFQEAMRLLKPGGVLALKFELTGWPWMGERFHTMLTRVAGRAPVVFDAAEQGPLWGANVFLVSNSEDLWSRAAEPQNAAFLAERKPLFVSRPPEGIPATTDNWPYVYHRGRSIPRTYLTVTLLLLLVSFVFVGRNLDVREPSTWTFFLLGSGFLCLETQMVSRLALYFGSTWLINCIVISTVLIMLVGANLYVERRRAVRTGPAYAALLGSLAVVYLFPWPRVPLGATAQGLVMLAAYAVPVLCAGVIFAESFRRATNKSSALGANLLGATLGGITQNLSFIFGLQSLLLVAAVLYGGALVADRVRGANRMRHFASEAASAR